MSNLWLCELKNVEADNDCRLSLDSMSNKRLYDNINIFYVPLHNPHFDQHFSIK